MDLYHFTGVPMLHGIMASPGINRGYIVLADNSILQGWSWFTTSPLPYGHGLCDGTEIITEKKREFIRRLSGNDKPVFELQNKRLIRIKIDADWLKKQEGFYSYINLMRELNQPKLLIKYAAIDGWVDFDTLSDAEVKKWMKSPKTKEKTWYVFNGLVPSCRILSVEFMEKTNNYVPYDFEMHGRAIMEKTGLHAISESLLQSLNSVVHTQYLPGSVIAFCQEKESLPSIIFRNSSFFVAVELQTVSAITHHFDGNESFELDKNIILAWVSANKRALNELWQVSVESYHRFYG